MQYSFKRKYSLIIGTPPRVTKGEQLSIDGVEDEFIVQGFNTLIPTDEVIGNITIPAEAKEINNLHIDAKLSISKEDKGQPIQTLIEVFNLDKDTIDFISRKNSLVILKAGYESDEELPIIFSGQIKNVHSSRIGADLVTTIQASDGFTPATGVKVSLSLMTRPPQLPLTYSHVFEELVKIWKVNGVTISEPNLQFKSDFLPSIKNPEDVELPKGWAYEGLLQDAMTDLCNYFGCTWYIQNNILFVHPVDDPKFTNVINLNSRQIKDIRRMSPSEGTSTEDEKTGITVNTFLFGDIQMGNILRVLDGDFKGDYNIKSISHSLSYRGSNWDTIVEAEVSL